MEWLKINGGGEIEFASEEIKLVPEVQALLALKYNKAKGDLDGRRRYRALAELKYLYLAYSSKGPYTDYSEAERFEEAKKDCQFPADWVESPELIALLPKFLKGNTSKIERLLRTAEKFLDKLEDHLNSLDLKERKDDGTYINKPKEIIDALKQLPSLAQILQDLERQIRSGTIGVPTSKGDHEIGWMEGNELDRDEENENI